MLASAVALGVGAGVVFGGDLRRLGSLSLRAPLLLLAAAAIRVAGLVLPLAWPLYAAALVGFAAVALLNRHLPGALLIALGVSLNALVVLLNAGMPVDMAAVEMAGSSFREDGLHIPLGPTTLLPVLADVLPFPLFRNVYSVGDVVLAAGGFWLPFRLIRPG